MDVLANVPSLGYWGCRRDMIGMERVGDRELARNRLPYTCFLPNLRFATDRADVQVSACQQAPLRPLCGFAACLHDPE